MKSNPPLLPAASKALHQQCVMVTNELGWDSADERAVFLSDWLARHRSLVKSWNPCGFSSPPDLYRYARAFNRKAEILALELAARLGVPAARAVAALVPLWRSEEATGALYRSTLSGESFDDPPDVL